jgi:hypothetical protein
VPVPGRKPKAPGQAVTRHASTHDWTEVADCPFDGAVPKLPPRKGGWPARTRRKWAAWSSMPHCSLWSESDWDFAIDTLEVAARFHDGDARLATELRNRERVLGTTVDYRRDLRIRYVQAQPTVVSAAGVTSLSDYREL